MLLSEDNPVMVAFIQTKFAASHINISEELCRYIIARVENIPYYIQLLSAEIGQYMMPDLHEVTAEVVDECFIKSFYGLLTISNSLSNNYKIEH